MKLIVIGYPILSAQDERWIEDVRHRYSELSYSVLPPHFTFVFPLHEIDQNELVKHVRKQLSGWRSIPFVIRCGLTVKDDSSNDTYVFLTPDEGFSGIVRLHDQLYTGVLAAELRLDIPFIPHMTVGYAADSHLCKRATDYLNQQPFEIRGILDAIEIVSIDHDKFQSIERVLLS